MAGRITKFLRRQTPEPPEVTEAVAQLARLAETQADLRRAAALQSALLRAMYAAPVAVFPVSMTAEDAAAQLAGGVSLLRNVALPCEARHLRDIFLRLCKAATTVHAETRPGAPDHAVYTTLAEAAKQGHLDLWTLGNTWLTGDVQALPAQLEAQGYAADLVLTLLRLTLLPCLEQVAMQLAPSVPPSPGDVGTVPPVVPGLYSPSSAVWNNGAICAVASAPVPGKSTASFAPSAPRGTFMSWAICKSKAKNPGSVSRPAMPVRAT